MKWSLVPYGLKYQRLLLFRHFRVAEVPSLIIIDGNGKIINNDGVLNLENDPQGKNFPWPFPSLKSMLCDFIQWKDIDVKASDTEEIFYRYQLSYIINIINIIIIILLLSKQCRCC